jgi:hypothetical protein
LEIQGTVASGNHGGVSYREEEKIVWIREEENR